MGADCGKGGVGWGFLKGREDARGTFDVPIYLVNRLALALPGLSCSALPSQVRRPPRSGFNSLRRREVALTVSGTPQ